MTSNSLDYKLTSACMCTICIVVNDYNKQIENVKVDNKN